jgi:hypothetical protein
MFTCMDLLVTTGPWVWFVLSMSLFGWSLPIFRLPAYLWPCIFVHMYGSSCDHILMGLVWYIHGSSWLVCICSPVWIYLWLQPHGFGLVCLRSVSCCLLPFSGYLPTFGAAFVHPYGSSCDYSLMVWFGIFRALAGWSPPIFRLPAYLWSCICSPVWIYPWLQPHGRELAFERGTWRGRSIQVPQKRQCHEIRSNSCYFHVKNKFSWWQSVTTSVADPGL